MTRIIHLFFYILFFTSCFQQNKKLVDGISPSADSLLAAMTVTIDQLEIKNDEFGSLALYQGQPFSGIAYHYFENGNKQLMQGYLEGRKEGSWAVWYAEGGLQKEGLIRDGKNHGVYREWYENGGLQYEYQYDQDKKIGVWKGWYDNGVPYTIRHFNNDTLDGKVMVYDTSGVLTKEYLYKKGVLVNKINHFEKEQP